ncbi:fimbrial biogenesis outer membrane usher protein [Vibrio parahaemolyticus]|nr:fimbrial biogenesis outer membrane usher protein [Vibrio parahaemolyticus]
MISPISFRLICLLMFVSSANALGAEATFNLRALETGSPVGLPEDLSTVMDNAEGLIPGDYNVDIWFNNRRVATKTLHFVRAEDGSLKPDVSAKELTDWGVNPAALTMPLPVNADTFSTSDWDKYIKNYQTKYNSRGSRLDITVPQVSVRRSAAGEVSQDLWDDGIPVMLLSYDVQGNHSDTNHSTSDNYYGNFQSGLNIGGWRLRNSSSFTRDAEGNTNWDSYGTKIFHDLRPLHGRFEAGNTWTRSSIFDSVRFNGVQVYSDDSMLPYSQRGFAPMVRGIADTNATVSVRQHGSVIYQTVVSPGAFMIDDINPNSLSGDLEVTIKEEDGRERKFIQPFSSVPDMVREGQVKYYVSAGKRDSSGSDGKALPFTEVAVKYGIMNDLTMYGGAQVADGHDAVAFGLGFGLGSFGAISLDATQSHTRFDDGEEAKGQSYSINYSKSFVETGSSVTLAGYRYSTEDYYSLEDVADIDTQSAQGHRARNKTQITFSQAINNGEWGSMSLSGYRQSYWSSEDSDLNLSVSYSNSIGPVSYSIDYTEYRTGDYDENRRVSLYLSVPLDRLLPGSYASYTMTRDNNNDQTQQVTLSGMALENNNLSWSLSGSTANHGGNSTFSGSSRYQGSSGELYGRYSQSENYKQLHYGMRGGMVLHGGGLTLSRNMGTAENGIILVDANGADDIAVSGTQGISTDYNGYAVRSYASSYNHNRVTLDGRTLGKDMDIGQTVTDVVPTVGAVVKASFDVAKGYRALFIMTTNGKDVPFGAQAYVEGVSNMTFVGDGGELYLSGLKPEGTVLISWPGYECKAQYSLDENNAFYIKAGLFNKQLECR